MKKRQLSLPTALKGNNFLGESYRAFLAVQMLIGKRY